MVYLDHIGGTPTLPEVAEAMQPYFRESYGSASAFHRLGLQAREALEKARESCAQFVNAESPEQIIFTSSGTEATNLAIKGTAWANQRFRKHIVYTAIEHPAVTQSIEFLITQGFTGTKIPVDSEGRVDPEAIRSALTDETALVCVHHANHDIGTIEPIAEIGQMLADRGIPLFVDAVASAGWIEVDVQKLGATLLAFSPHRFYGPRGVGGLYRHRRARLTNLIHGGVQEGGRRAGSENIGAIVGAGVACTIAKEELPNRGAHVRKLQEQLWTRINRDIQGVQLNGPPLGVGRLPNLLNFSVENVEGEGMALALDMKGFAVASGSSCLGKSLKIPPVLEAIGTPHRFAIGNLIASFGIGNSAEEIDAFVAALKEVAAKLRSMAPSFER